MINFRSSIVELSSAAKDTDAGVLRRSASELRGWGEVEKRMKRTCADASVVIIRSGAQSMGTQHSETFSLKIVCREKQSSTTKSDPLGQLT